MKIEMVISVQLMERTGGLRSAGTDVSDVRGRLNEKFALMEKAHEFEMSLWQLVQTMLVTISSVVQKMAIGNLVYRCENIDKPFCRKSRKLQVYPKRFNLTTVGKLQREFTESLQLRIFRRRKRNIIRNVSCSGICSSFMRPTMTPQFNDAPADPSKSQEEEGICHGGAQYHEIEKLNMHVHASMLFETTSVNDGAIRCSAASLETGPAICTEFSMRGDIQTTIHSEPVEAHRFHSDSSTHASSELGAARNSDSNSELGEAQVNNDNYIQYDDYINSHSKLGEASACDVIVPSTGCPTGSHAIKLSSMRRPFDNPWPGIHKGNYADSSRMLRPFLHPWAGSS